MGQAFPQVNIRLLLVDDHPVIREGLRAMLSGETGIDVIAEASSGEDALKLVNTMGPDVVLMDVRMPGMGGVEATRHIKKAHPAVAVIMLTMYDAQMYMVEALRAGCAGYLTKDASRELLCHAVRSAAAGGTLVRSDLLRQAMAGIWRLPETAATEADSTALAALTPREAEVFSLLAQGYSNKDLCAELDLAEVTVKKHVQNIIGKLGVSDRTHAAILGVRMGLAG